jgi:hypothetical protein
MSRLVTEHEMMVECAEHLFEKMKVWRYPILQYGPVFKLPTSQRFEYLHIPKDVFDHLFDEGLIECSTMITSHSAETYAEYDIAV